MSDKEAKQQQKAAEKQAKETEKQRAAADKAAQRDANKLRAGDKASTVSELTMHVSGSAYSALDDEQPQTETEDEDEEEEITPAMRRKRAAARRKRAKTWTDIVEQVQKNLEEWKGVVEAPEEPRQDVHCEGAVRWTRWCDRKWDDQTRRFIPLGAGNEIVLEEDTRLVFM